MATTTAQRPWTEAEVREALAELHGDFDVDMGVWDALDPLMDSDMARERIGWDPDFQPNANRFRDPHPGTLWADLRPSETAELHSRIQDAVHAAYRRFLDEVLEQSVRIALEFDGAHPDVPRGQWKPSEGGTAAA